MAKQGDSDAHDAGCWLSEPTAAIKRGLQGWIEPAAKRLFAGDARSSPPAEFGHAHLHIYVTSTLLFPRSISPRILDLILPNNLGYSSSYLCSFNTQMFFSSSILQIYVRC